MIYFIGWYDQWRTADARVPERFEDREQHLLLLARQMAMVNYRDYHSSTQNNGCYMTVEPAAQEICVTAYQAC